MMGLTDNRFIPILLHLAPLAFEMGTISRFARKSLLGNGPAQPRLATDLALQAAIADVWRRKHKFRVMAHSDQGSQSTRREWQMF